MSWDTTKLLILWALSEVAVCPLPVPFIQYPICHGICEVLRIENPLPAEGSLKFDNREKCAVLVEIILFFFIFIFLKLFLSANDHYEK